MREYITYISDLYVPYNKEAKNEIGFIEKDGKNYLDFTKTTFFQAPSFSNIEGENMMQVNSDSIADVVEQQEKEKLLALSIPDRVKELRKTVKLYCKDFDSCEVFGYELMPYLNRFTRNSACELLQSLPEAKQVVLLSLQTRYHEYGDWRIDKGLVLDRYRRRYSPYQLSPEEIAKYRQYQNADNFSKKIFLRMTPENQKKLDDLQKPFGEVVSEHKDNFVRKMKALFKGRSNR